jgi:hypothetical protein
VDFEILNFPIHRRAQAAYGQYSSNENRGTACDQLTASEFHHRTASPLRFKTWVTK